MIITIIIFEIVRSNVFRMHHDASYYVSVIKRPFVQVPVGAVVIDVSHSVHVSRLFLATSSRSFRTEKIIFSLCFVDTRHTHNVTVTISCVVATRGVGEVSIVGFLSLASQFACLPRRGRCVKNIVGSVDAVGASVLGSLRRHLHGFLVDYLCC